MGSFLRGLDTPPQEKGVSLGDKVVARSLDLFLTAVEAVIKIADAVRKRVDAAIDS